MSARRVRVALAALAAGLAVTAAPGEARAEGKDPPNDLPLPKRKRPESPQHFAAEVRVGPYTPAIDSEPALAGRTPYADAFGDPFRPLVALEVDWQALRIPYLGTLGPGLGAGLFSASRDALTLSGAASGDTTGLNVYPFWADAVLRADVVWRELRIPIVPWAKAGLGMALWRATNSTGTANVGGVAGKGMTWGTHFALGAGFALDALDPGATRNLDEVTGINHTYFFAEYYWLGLDSFGSDQALRVGSNSWALGLAFEF